MSIKAQQPTGPQTIVIKPDRGLVNLDLGALWNQRELLLFFVVRDIKVRYKQTVIGAGWAIIQPLMTMVIFTIIFGNFAKIPSDGLPYPIFAYAALLPWTYFSQAVNRSSSSVVGAAGVITKVYFPRLIVPMSGVVAPLVDMALAFVILVGLMAWFWIAPTWGMFALPLFVLLAMATAMAAGLWLSAVNAIYRDVTNAVPFMVQFWMWASPVAYPASLIPEKWRMIYSLNPMVGVIEGFRWALLGHTTPDFAVMGISTAVVALLLVGGAFFFKRMETTFIDVV